MYPLKDDKIQYQLSKKLECKWATVLSRAHNATGKYKSFYNILNKGHENPATIDFDFIHSWETSQTILILWHLIKRSHFTCWIKWNLKQETIWCIYRNREYWANKNQHKMGYNQEHF